jgi:hypothetical protein
LVTRMKRTCVRRSAIVTVRLLRRVLRIHNRGLAATYPIDVGICVGQDRNAQ